MLDLMRRRHGGLMLAIASAVVMGMAWVAISVAAPLFSRHWLVEGRAYLAGGRPEQAVAAYTTYTQLRPRDPVGYLELGEAWERACSDSLCPQALEAWRAAGIEPDQFTTLGDAAMRAQDWAGAAAWYLRASMYRPMGDAQATPETAFKTAVASLLAGKANADSLVRQAQEGGAAFTPRVLTDSLTLRGADLMWLTPVDSPEVRVGTPLGFPLFDPDEDVGTMWWNGEAGTLLDVQQAGRYLIRATLGHGAPAPVHMHLGVDGEVGADVSLGRGDDSWEDVIVDTTLGAGYHVVQISFLNNAVVGGLDRNAHLKALTIERIS